MADSIIRLKVESQEYDAKLKRASEGLTRYADECRKVGGTMEVVEKDTLAYVRSLGRMDTVSRTATGKLAEMKKAFTELSAQYKQMTAAEKASPFGRALAQSLGQLKTRIGESRTQLDGINKELNGGNGLSGALEAVAGKLGLNVGQLTKFGAAAAAATAAVKVARDAFMQSESNIDEWGRTVEGAKGAYDVFLQTINGGNWTNFLQNLTAAIQGARDLYNSLDRLNSIKSNNQAAIALAQQQVQQLRLMKQQGKDVDAQLKEAVKNLAALQSQSVVAGRVAGRDMVANTIRNRVNASNTTGVNVSDAAVRGAASRVIRGGQAAFDSYTQQYNQLRRKGLDTYQRYNERTNTYYNEEVFNLAKLSESEQKRYLIAEAVKERETEIQKGIGIYAQAVQEGASSAREQFKGNRYAMQGTGGGASGNGGVRVQNISTKYRPGQGFGATESMDDLRARQQYWQRQAAGATNAVDYASANTALSDVAAKMNLQPVAMSLGVSTEEFDRIQSRITEKIESMAEGIGPINLKLGIDPDSGVDLDEAVAERSAKTIKKLEKQSIGAAEATQMAAQATSSLGAALAGLEDPAAKAAGTVLQAIANIALGFATASTQAASMGPWAWLAFLGAGAAAMGTTIATIHALTGYTEGGEITGNSLSGDNQLARVNAGEIILNRAQQSNVAGQLEGVANSGASAPHPSFVRGQDIYLGVNNFLKSIGRGQLVTTR